MLTILALLFLFLGYCLGYAKGRLRGAEDTLVILADFRETLEGGDS